MAAWLDVVATRARVRRMAGGAGLAIDRREFAVQVVLPARGVGNRHHRVVAGGALILRDERGRHALVADETLRVRRRGFRFVIPAEVPIVIRRTDISSLEKVPTRMRLARGLRTERHSVN